MSKIRMEYKGNRVIKTIAIDDVKAAIRQLKEQMTLEKYKHSSSRLNWMDYVDNKIDLAFRTILKR